MQSCIQTEVIMWFLACLGITYGKYSKNSNAQKTPKNTHTQIKKPLKSAMLLKQRQVTYFAKGKNVNAFG